MANTDTDLDDAARAALLPLVDAIKAIEAARAGRARFIVRQYRRGVRVVDIARALTRAARALAEEHHLTQRQGRDLGVSEASAHLALTLAKAKR